MADHPIQGLMTTAMESLKEMIDVNTIIGDPVETPDGSVILTVSKVGFGFAAGGSEFQSPQKTDNKSNNSESGQSGKNQFPFGGGSGGGVSITPIAFLVVNSSGVKTIHLDENTHLYERLIDLAPQAVEKIQSMLSSKKNDQSDGKAQQNGNQNNGQKMQGDIGI
jgi:sporulation protein YtfJ